MITFQSTGDFRKLSSFLEKAKKNVRISILDQFAKDGLASLIAHTPVDTGMTSNSWRYNIVHEKESARIEYFNDNIQNGIPIAIILQYGHATRSGGWVQGVDYINPSLKNIFDKLANEAWKGVSSI